MKDDVHLLFLSVQAHLLFLSVQVHLLLISVEVHNKLRLLPVQVQCVYTWSTYTINQCYLLVLCVLSDGLLLCDSVITILIPANYTDIEKK